MAGSAGKPGFEENGGLQMYSKVLDADHLEVFFRPGAGDTALLTFNELGLSADGRRFWGQAVCDRLDLPAVGIMSRSPNWYPATDMDAVARLVRPLLSGFTHVVAYGHSQGGYGALKYGHGLGATRAAAFCPQATIEPRLLGAADTRFTPYYRSALHDGMAVAPGDCPVPAIVVFDPALADDLMHVRMIQDACGAGLVPLRHVGHKAVRLVAGHQPFQRFLDLLTDGSGRDAVRSFLAGLRKAAPLYRSCLFAARAASREKAGDRDGAALWMARSAQADPADLDGQLAAGGALVRYGHLDEALTMADAMCGRWPDSHLVHAHRAFVLQRLGRLDEAVAALDRAIGLAPAVSGLRARMAGLLTALGQPNAALAAARHAVALGPAMAHNHARLGDVLAGLGQQDEAIAALDRAVALAPYDPHLLNHRAMLLVRQGQAERAAADVEAAIALAPSDQGLRRHLERIRGLGGK